MTIDAAIVAVADFLQPLAVDYEIIRGVVNNAPPPKGSFIVLTEIGQPQYTTTRYKASVNGLNMAYNMPKYLNIQVDFYGNTSGDVAFNAATMLRSLYAVEKFPSDIKPLFCSDAVQAPLTTGEKQYLKRWFFTLSLQYISSLTLEQESFNKVGETFVDPVDVTTNIVE